MYLDTRTDLVRRLLADFVRSPSLRHLRDERSLEKLATEIVKQLDQSSSVWRKWDGPRQTVIEQALECWIPTEDLLSFLNSLPGPELTRTDVEQYMRHLIDDQSLANLEEDLRSGCLEIYHAEAAAGTEMPAIIGKINQYITEQWPAQWEKQRQAERDRLDAARLEREARLQSAADCPWTQIKGSRCLYCRKNGRTFRLSPTRDKMWLMHRVQSVDDQEAGDLIGQYRTRGDASKVVAKAAYEPEPRW